MISCGHPGVPANAILTGDLFTYGAVVHYSCRGSRSLVGDSSRACQEDSHWSGALLHCTGGLARAVVHHGLAAPVSKVVTNPFQPSTPLGHIPGVWGFFSFNECMSQQGFSCRSPGNLPPLTRKPARLDSACPPFSLLLLPLSSSFHIFPISTINNHIGPVWKRNHLNSSMNVS